MHAACDARDGMQDRYAVLNLSEGQTVDGEDGRAVAEKYAEVDAKLYSSVQSVQGVSDEKELLMLRYPMNTEVLKSARGGRRIQSHIQTPRGKTLMREGVIQREICTENSTFCELQHGTRGLAPSISAQQQQTPGDGVEMDKIS